MATKKSGISRSIIKAEFEKKKEALLRGKQLDLALTRRHQGIDDFRKGDMKPFTKSVKLKLKSLRKANLIK